jgi:hypothetical protein
MRLQYVDDFAEGAVVRDFNDRDTTLRGLVVRGPYSWCAYVGAPVGHFLSTFEELEFNCHWGITFRGRGEAGSPLPSDHFWFGWDYGHAGDATLLSALTDGLDVRLGRLKRWTVDEVAEHVLDVMLPLREQVLRSDALARVVLYPALRSKGGHGAVETLLPRRANE